MSYYSKSRASDGWHLAKTRKDCSCLVCKEPIAKGSLRYVRSRIDLCGLCLVAWKKEGGALGMISRAKKDQS